MIVVVNFLFSSRHSFSFLPFSVFFILPYFFGPSRQSGHFLPRGRCSVCGRDSCSSVAFLYSQAQLTTVPPTPSCAIIHHSLPLSLPYPFLVAAAWRQPAKGSHVYQVTGERRVSHLGPNCSKGQVRSFPCPARRSAAVKENRSQRRPCQAGCSQ